MEKFRYALFNDKKRLLPSRIQHPYRLYLTLYRPKFPKDQRTVACTYGFDDLEQLNKYKRHAEYWVFYYFDKQLNNTYVIPCDDEFQRFTEWITHEDSLNQNKESSKLSSPSNSTILSSNVEGACLNFASNHHAESYTKFLLKDNFEFTSHTSLENCFATVHKTKKYFRNPQLLFLQSLDGAQFMELLPIIVLHALRRSGVSISKPGVDNWLKTKSITALVKNLTDEIRTVVREVIPDLFECIRYYFVL